MSPLNGKRVLIVEDEFFIADVRGKAVETAGGLVIGPFASAGEAQKALVEDVDLAVLDINVRDGVTCPSATQLGALGIPSSLRRAKPRRQNQPSSDRILGSQSRISPRT